MSYRPTATVVAGSTNGAAGSPGGVLDQWSFLRAEVNTFVLSFRKTRIRMWVRRRLLHIVYSLGTASRKCEP